MNTKSYVAWTKKKQKAVAKLQVRQEPLELSVRTTDIYYSKLKQLHEWWNQPFSNFKINIRKNFKTVQFSDYSLEGFYVL